MVGRMKTILLLMLRNMKQALALLVYGMQYIREVVRSSFSSQHQSPMSTSLDIVQDIAVAHLMKARPLLYHALSSAKPDCFIGWGNQPSGKAARRLAERYNRRFLLLEDGFLRSVGRTDASASLVMDEVGIYYDALGPSAIEDEISRPLAPEEKLRALSVAQMWKRARVSKYNGQYDYLGELPPNYVLVVDQTFGDNSVSCGLASEASFQVMLKAAIAENPLAVVVVKTHPDIQTRGKAGYFSPKELAENPRVKIISDACHPVRLIENADTVYTVTSQMGFEALVWGKRVRVFGMPFYAGWGLTDDELPAPDRRTKVDMEQLVHAALIAYPRYWNPETGCECRVEHSIESIRLQRERCLQEAVDPIN